MHEEVMQQYLRGIRCDTSADFPGLYFTEHHSQKGSWRILGTYTDLHKHKSKFFSTMQLGGQNENPEEWDIDHIVEGHDYADVDITGNLQHSYDNVLPCVLIYKKQEHATKTPTMRTRARREIYLPYRQHLHGNRFDRAQQARSLWLQLNKSVGAARAQIIQELRERISALQKLYVDYYGRDYVLKRVAWNVFEELLSKLR
jgi:hypothetical protein